MNQRSLNAPSPERRNGRTDSAVQSSIGERPVDNRVRGCHQLLEESAQVLRGVAGGAVPVPVDVGLPVDRRRVIDDGPSVASSCSPVSPAHVRGYISKPELDDVSRILLQ